MRRRAGTSRNARPGVTPNRVATLEYLAVLVQRKAAGPDRGPDPAARVEGVVLEGLGRLALRPNGAVPADRRDREDDCRRPHRDDQEVAYCGR